jgi:hypothetical protein
MYRAAADLSLSLVEAQNLLLLNVDMFICYGRIACRFIDNIQDRIAKAVLSFSGLLGRPTQSR